MLEELREPLASLLPRPLLYPFPDMEKDDANRYFGSHNLLLRQDGLPEAKKIKLTHCFDSDGPWKTKRTPCLPSIEVWAVSCDGDRQNWLVGGLLEHCVAVTGTNYLECVPFCVQVNGTHIYGSQKGTSGTLHYWSLLYSLVIGFFSFSLKLALAFPPPILGSQACVGPGLIFMWTLEIQNQACMLI